MKAKGGMGRAEKKQAQMETSHDEDDVSGATMGHFFCEWGVSYPPLRRLGGPTQPGTASCSLRFRPLLLSRNRVRIRYSRPRPFRLPSLEAPPLGGEGLWERGGWCTVPAAFFRLWQGFSMGACYGPLRRVHSPFPEVAPATDRQSPFPSFPRYF